MAKELVKEEYIPFSERLTNLRKKTKKTQAQLAGILDISVSSIQKYERATRFPSGYDLIKMKNFFGVSLEYLLAESTTEDSKYASLEDLGIKRETIEYLMKAHENVKINKPSNRYNYNMNYYINLIAVNNLLKEENQKIISMIGKTLISKKIEEKKKATKSKYSNSTEYKFSLFSLMNMFDEFFTNTKVIDDVDFRLSDIEDMFIYNWDKVNPKPTVKEKKN